ncbi:MAG: autotransporter assembly complex family protein [Geothermobacteraceae bacterium]
MRTFCLVLITVLVLLLPEIPSAAERGARLRVQGLTGDPLANVEAALQLPAALATGGKETSLWLRRYLRKVPARVAAALEPFGYYRARTEVTVTRVANGREIRVTVDPGPPARVSDLKLSVAGDIPAKLEPLVAEFGPKPGEVLDHRIYEKSKAALLAAAQDLGYLAAAFTRHRIEVDPAGETATIDAELTLGRHYRFGDIRVEGGDGYPDRFLRRFLTFRPGDPFSYDQLGRSQRQLLDSDRFSTVALLPQHGSARGGLVPVRVQLTPKKPRRLRPGIGYATDTGARITLRYQDVNMLGLGHELNSDLLAAERRQDLGTAYLVPSYRSVDSLVALRGGYHRENLDTYETELISAELEQIYRFSRKRVGSWFVRLQSERSTISGDKVRSGSLLPGLRYTQRLLDSDTRPRRGYSVTLETRGTIEGVLSDISLMQIFGSANLLIPLPKEATLLLRSQFGTTVLKNPFDDVPASLRFFAGGDHSVRGYAYQELGPVDASGHTIGGKSLLTGSLELEQGIAGNWGWALFYDAGNAFDDMTSFELAQAAGLGLRWYSPAGPVRIDLARTLGEEKASYRLHLGLGVGW